MFGRTEQLLLLILGLDILRIAASSCIAGMMACTRRMASDIRATDNRTMLCGVMDVYMNCIECSCNVSLTLCDLSNTRSKIAGLLKDYGIQCDFYVPQYEEHCRSSMLPLQPSAMLVLCLALFISWILNSGRL